MAHSDHACRLASYLAEVCDRLEQGARPRPWRHWSRSLATVPLAVGLSLALTQCGGDSDGRELECTDDTCVDLCQDSLDNDGDGLVDCADPDCDAVCGIGQPVYGVPLPDEVCDNGVDDDLDGAVDCADPDCADVPGCVGELYGVPTEYCDDQVDNDGNGLVDCADPACAGFAVCQGLEYGIPYETDCANGVDDDGDNAIDCADPDCAEASNCVGLRYGIPY